MPAPYPTKSEIELPLLRIIAEVGGQAKPNYIYRALADRFGLLLEQRVVKSKTAPSQKQSRWQNDVQAARGNLVEKGALAPTATSGFGIWQITPLGEARLVRSNPLTGYKELTVKQVIAASRLDRQKTTIPCIVRQSLLDTDKESSWKAGTFLERKGGFESIYRVKLDNTDGVVEKSATGSWVWVSNAVAEALDKTEADQNNQSLLTYLSVFEDFFGPKKILPPAELPPVPEAVKSLLAMVARTRNVLLYGPPGTGKTWLVTQFAKAFTDANKTEMVTFHQSFAYEEFVEGIKPVIADHGQVAYAVQDGVFKRICQTAAANPSEKYLLIVDEINRANIAKVLGELITLVEDDKRLGEANEVLTTLPYSGEKFGVSQNLTILGTMNTADRSIALLDLALRRRFTFVEMPPDPSLLPDDVAGVNLQALLTRLNRRVSALLDPDHRIGHSYLMGVETEDDLHFAWYHQVLPLLQEYFYHDGERMQAVIGKMFVQEVVLDAETKAALGGAYEETAHYESILLTGKAFQEALQRIAGQ